MAVIARTRDNGLEQHVQENTACCFAVQDKTWVKGPENDWEFYTVLGDAPSMACGVDAATTGCSTDHDVAAARHDVRRAGLVQPPALEAGLLINVTADTVIRLLPPLNFTREQGEMLVDTLVPLVEDFLARHNAPQAVAQSA